MPAITTTQERTAGYGITPARAIIDDATLDAFAATAERAQGSDMLDDAGAQLLLALAAPMARELQQHRRAAALIRDLTEPGAVLMFPGAPA